MTQNIKKVPFEYPKGICHVHYLVHGDKEIRDIAYCSKCDAWICTECSPNKILRAKAMAISLLRRAKGEIDSDGFMMFPVFQDGKQINLYKRGSK